MASGQQKKLQNQCESEPLSKALCPHFLVLLRKHQILFFPLFLKIMIHVLQNMFVWHFSPFASLIYSVFPTYCPI